MIGTCGGEYSAYFHLFKLCPYPTQLYVRATFFKVKEYISRKITVVWNFLWTYTFLLSVTKDRVIIHPQSQDKNLSCACSIPSWLTWVNRNETVQPIWRVGVRRCQSFILDLGKIIELWFWNLELLSLGQTCIQFFFSYFLSLSFDSESSKEMKTGLSRCIC